MSPSATKICIVSSVVGLALACEFAHAETYAGTVIGVSDGDTVTVLDSSRDQHKVRLAGIDAPEKKQPFGDASRKQLAAFVFGRAVVVDYSKSDRYGREVGKILFAGEDVNIKLIQAGMAWHYKHYAFEQSPSDRRAYAQAEEEARLNAIGLWGAAGRVPPWDFRAVQRARRPTIDVGKDMRIN